jgi:heme-degrading monooxygenase HmoA
MIAVIFEVQAHQGQQQAYLDAAARMRQHLEEIPGFVSVERFASLSHPGKLLSLSIWRGEEAVKAWRNLQAHREMQGAGRERMFANYRIRVAAVLRDYGLKEREQAPADSRSIHG